MTLKFIDQAVKTRNRQCLVGTLIRVYWRSLIVLWIKSDVSHCSLQNGGRSSSFSKGYKVTDSCLQKKSEVTDFSLERECFLPKEWVRQLFFLIIRSRSDVCKGSEVSVSLQKWLWWYVSSWSFGGVPRTQQEKETPSLNHVGSILRSYRTGVRAHSLRDRNLAANPRSQAMC